MNKKQQERTIKRGDGFVEERPRKDGSIAYSARWHDGARMRTKTFNDLDSAYDHLRNIGRAKRKNTYTPESDDTVAEVLAGYIARGAHRWTSNTVATYSLLVKQQINPHLGKVRAVSLTTPRIQHWIDDLTTSGLSAAVIENARTVLGGAFKEALQLGMVSVNPVTGTRAPARKKTPKTTWTPDEAARVLESLADDVYHYAFYIVALTSAVRPGELRALQWQDVDMEEGVVTVRRSMTRDQNYRHKIGDTTKTKKVRAIGLPQETIDALRAHRADQLRRRIAAEAWKDRDIIFDRGDGSPLPQQTAANVHVRICQNAGVRRIRMHDLRHTAATLMLRNNVHPKIVSDILGHDSVNTTLDIYSHVDVSMQRMASEGLADTLLRGRKRA